MEDDTFSTAVGAPSIWAPLSVYHLCVIVGLSAFQILVVASYGCR